MNKMINPWLGLAIFLIICFAAAGIGGIFTGQSVDSWYQDLQKPAWNPPDWVFGPVWTFLYISMAIAAWLVWRQNGVAGAVMPLSIFLVQLVLNAAWSGLFFGLRDPALAFSEIMFLWATILLTILTFSKIRALAAVIMLPYFAWVSFAAILNFEICRLNS